MSKFVKTHLSIMSKTRRYLVEPNGIYEKSPLITLNGIYGELAYFSIYNVGGGD